MMTTMMELGQVNNNDDDDEDDDSGSGSGNDNKDTQGCVHASDQGAVIWLVKHVT